MIININYMVVASGILAALKIIGAVNIGWFWVLLPVTGTIFLIGLVVVFAMIYASHTGKMPQVSFKRVDE